MNNWFKSYAKNEALKEAEQYLNFLAGLTEEELNALAVEK